MYQSEYAEDMTFSITQYAAGGIKLQAWDEEGPVCTVSVCVPKIAPTLEENEIIVKDYAENAGIYDWLALHQLIKEDTGSCWVGGCVCPKVILDMDELKKRM